MLARILLLLAFTPLLALAEDRPAKGWPFAPVVPYGLGVNIHFTEPRPGELKMLAAGGFHWVRMDFDWEGTERVRGQYDFAVYDRLLAALDKFHLRAVFILDYGNKLYCPERSVRSEEARQAYARWAAAAAAHFQGPQVVWEIWNEPNGGFWSPKANVGEYVAMALAASAAIRQAAPEETIVGPATSQIDFAFLEECFKAGLLKYWDAVSVHPYRQDGPEHASAEYAHLRRLIARYAPPGKSLPILASEWGYSSAWKDYDPTRQAKMLAREWLTNLIEKIPLSIWYDWREDGENPHEEEHHFGTVGFGYHEGKDPVYEPKPAYLAARTLTTQLRDRGLAFRKAAGGADDYVVVFKHWYRTRLVLWTTAKDPHPVRIPSDDGSWLGTGMLGEKLPSLASKDGWLVATVTDAPQYLEFSDVNRALEGEPGRRALQATIEPGDGTILRVKVQKDDDFPLGTPVSLTGLQGIEAQAPMQRLEMTREDDEKIVEFPLKKKPEGAFQAGLEMANFLSIPPRLFAFVPSAAWASARVAPDGNAKLASEESFAAAPAPEPCPAGDGPVWKLGYRCGAGWKFEQVLPGGPPPDLPGEPHAFGFWVYGDGQGASTRVRVIDAKGQTWQPSGPAIDFRGWRYIEIPFDRHASHWGGPDDGAIHFPVQWNCFFLLDPLQREMAGEVYLSSPVVAY